MIKSQAFERRTFLSGVSVLALGAISLPFYPARLSSAEPIFDEAQSAALLRMVKDIFPHDMLDDIPYQSVVKDITNASSDPGTRDMIATGLQSLDSVSGGTWAQLESEGRVATLKAVEHSLFFITVRVIALFGLYGNSTIWASFGYEGASYDQGGYLFRGFNDLDWLPEPAS